MKLEDSFLQQDGAKTYRNVPPELGEIWHPRDKPRGPRSWFTMPQLDLEKLLEALA